jgi:hypothetical protein
MATSTTYLPTGITTALREDLSDVITNIAPTDTIFMSSIGKEKVKGKYHEWLTDTLTTAANCAITEGNDASLTTIAAQTRVGNYTQIAAKWFAVSDSLEAVDKAGRKSEIQYQTGLFLKMLARDMEYGLLNNALATSTDPRSAKGVKGFVTTNSVGSVGFTTGTASTTLTETAFNTAIQLCWTAGGNPGMVLCPANLKRKISAFTGNSKLTTNINADQKKVILSVDYYESDFGIVKIYASRFLDYDDGATYESVFILEKEKWALGTLQPLKTEKLAKTGLSTKIQMSTEYTLISRAENANARIKNCYVG